MSILSFIKNWKDFSTIWAIIQPFILKLIKKNVPTTITKLYENLAKYTLPYEYEFRTELPKTKVGKISYLELEKEIKKKEEIR